MFKLHLGSDKDSETGQKEDWRSALGTIALIIMAPLVAFFIAAFVIQSYQVDGQSMETTLQNGNRLLVDKLPRTIARITNHPYIPKRGDIVIFNQSGADIGYIGEKQLIKRVIGLPGEHMIVKDGHITVYNQAYPGGFDPDVSGVYHISAKTTPGNDDITLATDEIFVCGDNRGNSEDSRYFGPVKVHKIVGKMVLRVLPLNEAHHP